MHQHHHDRLSPSRNNRGVAHEDGIIEAPHGHVKRRLEQKLILRGSCDFEEAAEYGELLTVRVSRTSTIEVLQSGAQAPPRRGGEPLAQGARQLLRLQHAGGG
jgi:hypothetical protein